MPYTTFTLKSGAQVAVESKHAAPSAAGVSPASGVKDKARDAWSDGAELIKEVAEEVVSKLKEVTASAEEVAVEFGVSISGKTGVILVEGTASANLKVTIKWKRGA